MGRRNLNWFETHAFSPACELPNLGTDVEISTVMVFRAFWRGCALTTCVSVLSSITYAQPSDRQTPCEAFSQSNAVFVGEAGAPVRRWVQIPKHPPIVMTLTPMTVEQVYLGDTPSVMYLASLGIERYATPGQTGAGWIVGVSDSHLLAGRARRNSRPISL
jgi:hypothetical protein